MDFILCSQLPNQEQGQIHVKRDKSSVHVTYMTVDTLEETSRSVIQAPFSEGKTAKAAMRGAERKQRPRELGKSRHESRQPRDHPRRADR